MEDFPGYIHGYILGHLLGYPLYFSCCYLEPGVPEGKQVPGSGYCVFVGKAIIGLLPAGTLPLDRVLHGGEVHGQPSWRVSR